MIVVIADDLTGAAEIGGIALRYGLSAEVVTEPVTESAADVLVISTDTRSMAEADALKVTETVSNAISKLKPAFIYKKADSVLRGHIVAEFNIHQKILSYKKALLVPANPVLGRMITDGRYYINDKPIHETDFANDPEFPAISSEIHKILRVKKDDVFIAKLGDTLPPSGIIIGEVATSVSKINSPVMDRSFLIPSLGRGAADGEVAGRDLYIFKAHKPLPTPSQGRESHNPAPDAPDTPNNDNMQSWAKTIDSNTLSAGKPAFFEAIIESMGHHKVQHKINRDNGVPSLIVCGSSHEKSRNLVKSLKNNGQSVSYMPMEIVSGDSTIAYDSWADEIVSLIKKNKTAIIAIDNNSVNNNEITATELRNKKAVVVEKVFAKVNIKELIIEGGSTAAAIIKQLNFNRFFPVDEPGAGVIKMKVAPYDDLFLTLKPGSYNWPTNIWNF